MSSLKGTPSAEAIRSHTARLPLRGLARARLARLQRDEVGPMIRASAASVS